MPDVLQEHNRMMELIDTKNEADIEKLMTQHLYGGVRRLGGKMFSPEYSSYFQPLEL